MRPRTPEDYVFLYCQFDEFSGIRNYQELINTPTIREIDIENAIKALAEEDGSEVKNMIYYASSQAQQLEEAERNIYAAEILNEALRRSNQKDRP